MPLEKLADLEISIIKNIQSKIHSMEKYFRQLTGDQSITITLNINQNAIIISCKELSEETAAILKEQIQPFHTKLIKKINETKTVGHSEYEFEKNQITTTFDKKTQLLNFCTEFNRRFKTTSDYSTTFRNLGFISYSDNANTLKLVNIMESILIEIKNERIKKYLENTHTHPIKKTSEEIAELMQQAAVIKESAKKIFSEEITELTQQAAIIKENAKKIFNDNKDEESERYKQFVKRLPENPSYKDIGEQMRQITATLYQNARAESYDHYEQLTKDKIFYFHLQLLRADEVYAKAHALHEEIHNLSDLTPKSNLIPESDLTPEIKKTQKTVKVPTTFESLDEILNELDSTNQEKFIENLSISYCEILENLIGEICPSINDSKIRDTYHNAAEAINVFKTDPALSSTERLNQLQMFLESLTSIPKNTLPKKPKSTVTTTSQKFVSETKGSFSGYSIFSGKKTKNTPPALPSETKTESSAAEIFILEVLKKTQHSIEKLMMEENKKSFSSTQLSQ